MSDVGFVVAGWAGTAVVLGGYWFSVVVRLRRAERPVAEGASTSDGSDRS